MTDSALLDSLDGQQYLVLRPTAAVAAFYTAEQARLSLLMPGALPHPNAGHVTLRGFYEPTRVDELKRTLATWAKQQGPIELQVDRIDGFSPPFQVLIARLEPTPSLVDAYASLTATLDGTGLHRIGELPLAEWVFHLSLLYCNSLTEDVWEQVHAESARSVEQHPRELVTEVEFVWYEDGIEHAEVLTTGGSTAPVSAAS
jgi:hypothetical protein